MNTKTIPLVLTVVVLIGVVIVFRSLSVLSTVLLIGAGAVAFVYRSEADDSRKLPWQTWLLAGLSLAIYLVNWLVLGH